MDQKAERSTILFDMAILMEKIEGSVLTPQEIGECAQHMLMMSLVVTNVPENSERFQQALDRVTERIKASAN